MAHRAQSPEVEIIDLDLDNLHYEPLPVDAQPAAEAEEDVANATEESELEAVTEPLPIHVRDTGDLYGVRTPHAADTSLSAPEDQDSFDGATRGENWFESLEEHAATMGPVPEEEIVIVDDRDLERRPTERHERPIADKGSAGVGGL